MQINKVKNINTPFFWFNGRNNLNDCAHFNGNLLAGTQ